MGEQRKVLVIGAGAAGMMAAIAAADEGAEVTVLEGNGKPGRKLLMTGNGRCNLTNMDPHPERAYLSSDEDAGRRLAASVFSELDTNRTLDLFHRMGLLTRVEHGTYVYPLTGQASSVLDLLLQEMREKKVKLKLCEKVQSLERTSPGSPGYLVHTDAWTYQADAVVLAAGSKAAPQTGSDGSGLDLARSMGLDVTGILPALTGISVSCPGLPSRPRAGYGRRTMKTGLPASDLTSIAGIRMSAGVSAWADGIPLCRDIGQLQFTSSDLSGIVVFQVSRKVTRALSEGKDVEIRLDLIPAYTEDEVETLLGQYARQHPSAPVRYALTGILPDRLIDLVLAGTPAGRALPELRGDLDHGDTRQGSSRIHTAGELTIAEIRPIAEKIKCFVMEAVAVRGFDSCQICAGGVKLDEVDPKTLECRRPDLKGLYLAGEMLDIDGPCGGYNLQWAWSSGYAAGKAAAAAKD